MTKEVGTDVGHMFKRVEGNHRSPPRCHITRFIVHAIVLLYKRSVISYRCCWAHKRKGERNYLNASFCSAFFHEVLIDGVRESMRMGVCDSVFGVMHFDLQEISYLEEFRGVFQLVA